jgi:hypothetical protein
MATLVGSGISIKLDSFAGGKEASEAAYSQLRTHKPDITITFISTIFDPKEAIKGIRSVIKEGLLIGCSSAGSITQDGLFRASIAVFTISSDSINFSSGTGKHISKNSRLAGHEAAKEAFSNSTKDKTKQVFLIFSDGLTGNGADILRGTQEVLGTSFPIIGGAAADELCFQKSYQYLDNSIYSDSVVGLLISGDINLGVGKAHGWLPIGKPHEVTKAKANIIKEIDKKPAYKIYEEYFEKEFEKLKDRNIGRLGISYPLGMGTKEKNEYLIRVPMKIEEDGSLVLSADIPEGEDINLMMGDKNMALKATETACTKAAEDTLRHDIKFIAVFSDIARYRLLRKDSQKEIAIIKQTFGENIPIIGFYTYGEYASFEAYEYRTWSNFQNQTISIAVFSE